MILNIMEKGLPVGVFEEDGFSWTHKLEGGESIKITIRKDSYEMAC